MVAVCYRGFSITWFWEIGSLGLCFSLIVPNLAQKCWSTPKLWPKIEIQDGGRPPSWICYVIISDHPQSLFIRPHRPVKFYANLMYSFEDMTIWNFCRFGFKCLCTPPKFWFFGVWTPKRDWSSSRPPKGTSLSETARTCQFWRLTDLNEPAHVFHMLIIYNLIYAVFFLYNNNNNARTMSIGAVIMTQSLREFTRFIWRMQTSASARRPPTLRPGQPTWAASPTIGCRLLYGLHTSSPFYYYSARKLILILQSHGGWKAEST